MNYKTPGVYVQEISLFPPSVAQVETAVPAFIGYTERASDPDGNNLTNQPVRIKSLVEFQALFGNTYTPATYTIVADAATNHSLQSITPDKRFYLYDSLRQFYDNGGGNCYIVSVGSFNDAVAFDALEQGVATLRKVDEPTLLVCPDAAGLLDSDGEPDLAQFANLQKLLLSQCAELQDRFAILDIMEGYLPEDVSNTPIKDFRDTIGINNLSYGAAYYPWIVTSYTHAVGFRQLTLFDTADLDTQIIDLTPYAKNAQEEALTTTAIAAIADTNACFDVAEADKLMLQTGGSSYLRTRLGDYQANIARNAAPVGNMTDYLNMLAGVATAFARAEASAQADSGFAGEIALLQQDTELAAALVGLIAIEKNPATIANTEAARDAARINTLYGPLAPEWLDGASLDDVVANTTAFANNSAGRLEIISALAPHTAKILSSYDRLCNAALYFEQEGNNALFAGHEFFNGVRDMLIKKMRTVPPSATVAGIYAGVDGSRGVWKAPANVSINAIIGPAVNLDNKDQEDLNVSTSGKSINAIRAFTGRGSLVWGARTLAGNDNEWRYVPVRRFYIMAEESIKKATEPFVFEPNDANTWVKVRAMIENFLILQWRAGALQGAKPEEAFYVHVGLNETMTALDILEGRMIVEIGMAVVRPAEFIILRFSHLMQSGQG